MSAKRIVFRFRFLNVVALKRADVCVTKTCVLLNRRIRTEYDLDVSARRRRPWR
jgi:hypothetical protein